MDCVLAPGGDEEGEEYNVGFCWSAISVAGKETCCPKAHQIGEADGLGYPNVNVNADADMQIAERHRVARDTWTYVGRRDQGGRESPSLSISLSSRSHPSHLHDIAWKMNLLAAAPVPI